jgi:hypothetical protein
MIPYLEKTHHKKKGLVEWLKVYTPVSTKKKKKLIKKTLQKEKKETNNNNNKKQSKNIQ